MQRPELGLSLSEQAGRLGGWPEHNREEAVRRGRREAVPGGPGDNLSFPPGEMEPQEGSEQRRGLI